MGGPVQQLNLNLLGSLLALLQERNVSGAALVLHVSQSALSRQLAQLRDYFADPLLVRVGNGYVLTPKAEQLLPRVQTLVNQFQDLRQSEVFDPSQCQRRFRFAATDYVANFIFPEIMPLLQQQAPLMDIEFHQWQSPSLHTMASNQIELATTMLPMLPERLHGVHLGSDRPTLLMSSAHPLLAVVETKLSVQSMLDYSFVHLSAGGDKDSFFDQWLCAQGHQRRIAYQVPFFSAAFKVLECTQYLLVVPEHIAYNACQQYNLQQCALPLSNLPQHDYFLFWHEMHDADAGHTWLRELLATTIKSSIFSPLYATGADSSNWAAKGV